MNSIILTLLIVLIACLSLVIGLLKGRHIYAGIPINTSSDWMGGVRFKVCEDKTPDDVYKMYSVRFENEESYRLIRFTSTSGVNPLVPGYWYRIQKGLDQPIKDDTVMVNVTQLERKIAPEE